MPKINGSVSHSVTRKIPEMSQQLFLLLEMHINAKLFEKGAVMHENCQRSHKDHLRLNAKKIKNCDLMCVCVFCF